MSKRRSKKMSVTPLNSSEGSVRGSRRARRFALMNVRRKNKMKRKWLKRLGLAFLVLLAVGTLAVGSLFAYFAKDLPNPDQLLQRPVSQSTKIYDRTGQTVLYEIHGEENRTIVKLADIPQNMRDATVAIEDKDFYHHHGFVFTSILRAVVADVVTGKRSQGGSTITQQLVKNAILTNEKSFTRKIKELILSIEIEQRFTKDQILQLYLNEIPYGSNAYGVESASRTFFNKPASKLTLAEAAYLASLPQAPTYYSPYGSNTDALKARQQTVLAQMVDQGYITQDEEKKADEQKVAFADSHDTGIVAPHFVFYIREQLVETYGQTELEKGGLSVITTLDLTKQKIAEEEVSGHAKLIKSRGGSNAGLVAVDPHTGQVLAMVGSLNYFDRANHGNVNVTTSLRQPGSSFKPYVYATAFAKGYTPQTQIFDLNTDFGNGYSPRNYDLSQHGPLSFESALDRSLNIPAIKVGYLVGPENAVATARSMGVTNLPENGTYGLATSIGSHEIKLLEHTNAFGVFANQGKLNTVTGILKVTDPRGKVLEEYKAQNKQVLDANIANTMNNILSNNSLRIPTFGARNLFVLPDRPVAAKSGTSNDFRDALTVGYTPSLVAGVWVGNNDGHVMNRGADGSVVATPIWNAFMKRALAGTPVEQFVKPTPLPAPTLALQGKLIQGTKVTIDKATGKLWVAGCPEGNKQEVTFGAIHDLLYYIDKANPTGPPPSNPMADPMTQRWEGPVQSYAASHGLSNSQPPTETCLSAYTSGLKISITSPANGASLSDSSSVTIKASASSTKGITKVEFFVDGGLVSTSTSAPYTTSLTGASLGIGSHTITARATDGAGNQTTSAITLSVTSAPTPPAPPTVSSPTSPTTSSSQTLSGTKPAGTAVLINDVVVEPASASTTWSAPVSLVVGANTFSLVTKNSDGLTSTAVTVHITRI